MGDIFVQSWAKTDFLLCLPVSVLKAEKRRQLTSKGLKYSINLKCFYLRITVLWRYVKYPETWPKVTRLFLFFTFLCICAINRRLKHPEMFLAVSGNTLRHLSNKLIVITFSVSVILSYRMFHKNGLFWDIGDVGIRLLTRLKSFISKITKYIQISNRITIIND